MAHLFQPLTIRKTTIPNRIWLTPMCQFACMERDGKPGLWHIVNAGAYAAGGFGLVSVEATAVSPEGRITAQCAGIWNDEQRDLWKPVTEFIVSQGAVPMIQLAHAGRKASDDLNQKSLPLDQGGWETIGPSPLAVDGLALPRVMVQEDFDKVIADYVAASRRSLNAGFQVIEIHAAHGYLFHSFLSPLSNERTDEHGGSLANRARLLLQVVDAVRAEIGPDVPLFVRLSASDWTEGGSTPEETAIVSEWCREHGADLADISSGGLLRSVFISSTPGYQVPFAETVKKSSNILTAAVGKITTSEQAEAILAEGKADAVFIGRQAINDPHFARRVAQELGVEVSVPMAFRAGYW
jgi:2,4-dienoyl-CoA reductase-like NADH-dependent reductase (Old Yellow Enzyme family)